MAHIYIRSAIATNAAYMYYSWKGIHYTRLSVYEEPDDIIFKSAILEF